MPKSDDAYQHHLDTCYEVWRRGENPDRVDIDRSYDRFYQDQTPEESAGGLCRRWREQRDEQEQQEYPEEDQ